MPSLTSSVHYCVDFNSQCIVILSLSKDDGDDDKQDHVYHFTILLQCAA